ncbi:MAG: methionyl-tRNA formyltransferase [Afipia sp.]|nr:methionyl-tRNA formyltransferase [Afipia sp.]
MALIRKFEQGTMTRNSIHDAIDAKYAVVRNDDRTFVQIDTFGRDTREIPGKKSQTIQLNRDSGLQLIKILKEAFHVD